MGNQSQARPPHDDRNLISRMLGGSPLGGHTVDGSEDGG